MAAMRLALLLTIAAVAACAGPHRPPAAGPASVTHVVDGDTVTLYYGASDSVICGACLSVREILQSLRSPAS